MHPSGGTYIGSGKAQEIAEMVGKKKIDIIVINAIVDSVFVLVESTPAFIAQTLVRVQAWVDNLLESLPILLPSRSLTVSPVWLASPKSSSVIPLASASDFTSA